MNRRTLVALAGAAVIAVLAATAPSSRSTGELLHRGFRELLVFGVPSAALAAVLGRLLGVLATGSRRADWLIARALELVGSVPAFVLATLAATRVSADWALIGAVALPRAFVIARIVRADLRAEAASPVGEAARAVGVGPFAALRATRFRAARAQWAAAVALSAPHAIAVVAVTERLAPATRADGWSALFADAGGARSPGSALVAAAALTVSTLVLRELVDGAAPAVRPRRATAR